jgi:hypothetical protein
MKGSALDATIARLATAQGGLISRWQLLDDVRATARQIEHRQTTGLLRSIGVGLYSIGDGPTTWRQKLWAAVLQVDASTKSLCAVSDFAAGRLHHFDTLRGSPVVVASSLQTGAAPLFGRFRYLPSLRQSDIVDHEGLPVTSPVRTVLDLAMWCGERKLASIVDGAVRDRLLTEDQLRTARDEWRRKGRHGVLKLVRVLGDDPTRPNVVTVGRPESWLERTVLELFADAGLPPMVCQRRVIDSDGRLRRLDFNVIDTMLVVEVEGQRGHADRNSRAEDIERRAALTWSGFAVRTFTYDHVVDKPRWVVAEMWRELRALRAAAAC